jgi:hypothetical protein
MLGLEAPRSPSTCSGCHTTEGDIRCKDCFGMHLMCSDCTLSAHQYLPFHRLDRWNGDCFIKTSLFELGYVLHVGHGGCRCPANDGEGGTWEDIPVGNDDMSNEPDVFVEDNRPFDVIVVIDTRGVFRHRVSWCRCRGAPDDPMQLFQDQIFPASYSRPKTGFTFRVLDDFYFDAMECKTSAMSFFHKLRRMTDNAFPGKVHVSMW